MGRFSMARLGGSAALLLALSAGVLGSVCAPHSGVAKGKTSGAMTDSMARAIEAAQPVVESPPPPVTESAPPPSEVSPRSSQAPPPSSDEGRPPLDVPPGRFVAEVLDSTYFIEPAEFFALDLPVHSQNGAAAAHILGDVSVVGGRHDIIVRLFRSADYQNWLKRRGGRQAGPIWSSSRQRAVHLDQDLPPGSPVVLLLDNGYSLRTPKRVRVQVQLQYQGEPGTGAQNVSAHPAPPPQEGDITPRSNADDEFPPPPPPPPSDDK